MVVVFKILKDVPYKNFNYFLNFTKINLEADRGNTEFFFSANSNIFLNKEKKDLIINFPNKSQFKHFFNFFKNSNYSFSKGYFSKLELRGVGFKVYFLNSYKLIFNLGYSHNIVYNLPDDVLVFLKKGKLFFYSLSKEKLGIVLRDLKNLRIPDAYKAKGIVDSHQVFNLKEGKKR